MKMSPKAIAAKHIIKLGLPAPVGFVVNRSDLSSICQNLNRHPKIDYWHLRSDCITDCFLQKRVSNTADLPVLLSKIFTRAPSVSIIVQQRIESFVSGVIAKTGFGFYVEYIVGGLKSLLRDGVTPSRLALEKNGTIFACQYNTQEFWYKWEGEKLIRFPQIKTPILGKRELRILLNAACKFRKNAVYEWIQDYQGRLHFLDFKQMPTNFLRNKQSLLIGMENGTLSTLSTTILQETTDNIGIHDKGIILLPRPLHMFMDIVVPNATGLICRKGGLLSHLVVYASLSNIPCMISTKNYSIFRKSIQQQNKNLLIPTFKV
ncbi:MAG: hypothetical protein WCS89_02445 [Candidatus Paceibacterota bacterium]|jgi:hypothetical protein